MIPMRAMNARLPYPATARCYGAVRTRSYFSGGDCHRGANEDPVRLTPQPERPACRDAILLVRGSRIASAPP